MTESKIQSILSGLRRINAWRITGQRIVFTNGCFDLLHPGHVAYLEEARQLGDRLIIGINDDDSVRRLKGPLRPVLPLSGRARILAALESVDLVIAFSEDTPLDLILLLRPDVLVKGGDYQVASMVGAQEVIAWGGHATTIPFVDGFSTSLLLQKLRE